MTQKEINAIADQISNEMLLKELRERYGINKATAHYPYCCRSMNCGASGADCNNKCRNWIVLQAFEAWREAKKAVEIDSVWSPGYFQSTR